MASLPVDTLKQIGTIWQRLSAPGRVAVAATMILAVGGLMVVMLWARTPTFVILESGLDTTQASKIVEVLEAQGIDYRTSEQSTTILVPAQDVSRARLKLAGENLIPSPGSATLTESSPFDDKDTRKERSTHRLQIALAQTIAGFDGIDSATVNISLGKDSAFTRDKRPPTAAVNVRPDAGRTIDARQVQGIVRTLANAVTGLTEDNVTVTGADGRPLTRPKGDADFLGGSDSMSYLASFEHTLVEKVSWLLDPMVGRGHHSTAVTVVMNFDSSTISRITYDEEGKVAFEKDSEKTSTPQGGAATTRDPEAPEGPVVLPTGKSERKNEKYKVPETTTIEEKKTPVIKRITAAITVDEKVFTGEVKELEDLLAQALGLDTERGDKLTVIKGAFAEIEFPDIVAEKEKFAMDGVLDILQYAAAGLVGLGLLMFFRSVLKSRPGTDVPARTGTQLDLTIDDDGDLPEEKVSPKVLERRKLKKEIARAIDQDPRGVAKLVEMWLGEEGA